MKNSKIFEENKVKEIDKLEKQNQFLEKLQNGNASTDIFNSEQNIKIENILEKNKQYLYKLQSNEFEIAIVGLEKAGKSTFANALIENYVLPSAPERCTFTSTRLTNGSDKAVVEFYNENEFNDIFKELLKDIEYPHFEKENFKTLSIDKFKSFFDSLESKNPNLYKNHIGKTDKEIEDILNSRDRLTLSGKTKEFSGEELLSDSFQAYIKGENKGQDTSKPRSVKRVEINSSKLKKLESAVIYDVPGFDSPTKIHERQTIERLKSADAIILVTNVGRNPSLLGTQLNIITNNADSDGIPLRDKLFVFGNQLDTANSQDESNGNISTLKNDVAKYKIGEQKRVFTGSALKYLVKDKQIVQNDEYNPNWEFDSGIDKIYDELIYYYEHERFEILKRKIESNKRELKEIFKEILDDSEMDFDPNFAENEKSRITREAYKNIEANLENSLKKLKYELKKEIWEERYFSKKFIDDIENLEYFKEIDEEMVRDSKINEDDSLTSDTPIEKMNQAIRSRVHKDFLMEFSNLIRYMTDEKSKDVELRILRRFTLSIFGSDDSTLFDEIEKDSERLIQKLTSNISHNDGRFTYLIERFSRDIFDILLKSPLFSQDRKNKFKEAETEFTYLDNFYNKGDGTLINIILTGENKKIGAGLDSNDILTLSKTLVSFASNSYRWGDRMNEILNIGERLVEMASKGTKYNLAEILKDKKRSQTQEEVLLEINKDIESLKDILQRAVVPAINLELAFLNSIDKQIKILIDSFKSNDTENSKIFDNFISGIVPKVKSAEIGRINEKLGQYKMQQEFIGEMKEFEF
ncbi:MAG: dynamin family protein [Sulfurimonas sp.]|nr:dynamin family protein [Sulfurimonas sp.]